MKHTRTIVVALALLAAGGAGIALVGRSGAATVAAEDPRQQAPLVQTVAVRQAAPAERGFTGVVTARVQSNLGFRVPGKVVERLVDTGARVQAGQPLLRIDPGDLALALTGRENAVRAARAELVQAVADEARYRRLLAEGWAPRQRYEQARAVRDSAQAQLAAAEAQAQLSRNESGYAVLLADADGTVVETLAEPGQVVAAGQVVVRLAQAGAREAAINLPETARPALGSLAEASLYGTEGQGQSQSTARSAARLRQLADAADPASRTFEARYVLEGAAALAPLGATVTVWLPGPDARAAEAEVPLGAMLDSGGGSAVWVVGAGAGAGGGAVARRAVQLRRVNQDSAVVTGLQPGERIVALGAHLLRDGQAVRLASGQDANR